ncbi:pyrroloquinoline quinone biosynthesis peptide chaperone PqqD [Kushneria aurantia]|uniref:Pyrroloquinoline quinone biosynthesis peptide chaperone PqqD n=1 Tax=Kushneria aurantia TaxID=504092 RepID=A0ABV6G281_9GAMM|nr:pyrroloquinoline quinone biosynthesis peptide chaperone PqqD [Kushneria aurantia]
MSDTLTDSTVVRLPRGVRMRHDAAREGWVLLAPERIFQLDAIAHAVLENVDGERSLARIVDDLAAHYNAERSRIHHDVHALFRALIERGVLETV